MHYIKSKIKLHFFLKKNPEIPWLTKNSIQFLNAWLKPNDIGFEWGSGGSTLYFLKRVRKLSSVEHDEIWFTKISKQSKNQIKNIDDKFDYRLTKIDTEEEKRNYVNAIHEFNDLFFNFVLVDGRLRDTCAIAAIQKIKNGGLLIIDNIERYIPNESRSPASIGKNAMAKSAIWGDFIKRTKDFRRYWTSNGVWATVIYFIKW